ncbi:MAG: ROK family protein [Algoriphagus sp.]|uniref:ROK family protein n=1 Tax=Algoriphagus sp. TaxID=1872435 RepID=UPI002613BD5C|nr:ROK family protein [Algoriphagus sp.]MDG1275653.1 ROK family protein [Algoriphagus sp.]
MKLIGVDIGGSHISAASINFEGGELGLYDLEESSVDTSVSSEELISSWSDVILATANGSENFQLGIAMPGPYDYPAGVSLIQDQGKMKALYKVSVKNLLAQSLRIPSNHIQFTNDAEAFLLGESLAGSGKSFQNSIGITLGTGLGSAIKVEDVVKDAKLWTAPFRGGIAEDYLGTSWFVREAKKQFDLNITGVKDLVDSDLEKAALLFDVFGKTLGEFLFPYLIRLQSEAVILGGKIALLHQLFLPAMNQYLSHNGCSVKIEISTLGEQAALIGACQPYIKNHKL